ncbi:MAG: 50S ribosomal protein L32e [Thermoprotei archaeon]|mgnify:CR=1 FL=1|nr:MAG: 50S ribosomal protein L32e [Thermoprotei archaeon]
MSIKPSEREIKRLLKVRELLKKKPKFVRMNSWRLPRLREGWRHPRTLDNKIKWEKKGFPARVKIGYRKPKLVRGFHPCGRIEALVHNPEELEALDPEIHVVRIASTVGKRKEAEILKRAKELGLKVLNA